MTQREVITEAMLQAAIAALDRRIAMPPLPAERKYSRREVFVKLRGKAKEALAAGHTLETVLDEQARGAAVFDRKPKRSHLRRLLRPHP
jgi:hypothetical protein